MARSPHTRSRLLILGSSLASLASAAALGQGCGGNVSSLGPSDSGAITDATADVVTDSGSSDGATSDVVLTTDSETPDAPPGFAPAAHRPFPQVPDKGKTMMAPTLVTIVASNDAPTDGTDTIASLQAFGGVLAGSPVWAAVSGEYHLGALTAAAPLTGPAITAGTYTIDQLRTYVTDLVDSDAGAPAPNGNTVYLLYLPDGATTGYCYDTGGYPDFATSLGDEIAVISRCTPWANKETQLGQLTRDATAAVFVATTDPLTGGYTLGTPQPQPWTESIWQGWISAGYVELPSLCEGTRTFEELDGGPPGGWEFQRIYSNAAAAAGNSDPCVPPYGEPYYSVSVPQDWYPVQPGQSVSIPVNGWSAAATSEWLIYPHVSVTSATGSFVDLLDGGVNTSSPIGVGTGGNCLTRWAMNNGVGATVELTASPTAASGDYVVFRMDSFREDSTCYPPVAQDDFHFWPVGVYVP
jgi:hypothetical protein